MNTKNVIIGFFVVSVIFTLYILLRKKPVTVTANNLQDDNASTGSVDFSQWQFNANTWGGAESEYTEEEWNEINSEFEDMGSGWGG
jgi:hypothetical protein